MLQKLLTSQTLNTNLNEKPTTTELEPELKVEKEEEALEEKVKRDPLEEKAKKDLDVKEERIEKEEKEVDREVAKEAEDRIIMRIEIPEIDKTIRDLIELIDLKDLEDNSTIETSTEKREIEAVSPEETTSLAMSMLRREKKTEEKENLLTGLNSPKSCPLMMDSTSMSRYALLYLDCFPDKSRRTQCQVQMRDR